MTPLTPFQLIDRIGLPLYLIAEKLNKEDLKIDWVQFISEALEAGWEMNKIYKTIKEAREEIINGSRR